jgi:hypothetical protein
MSPRNPGTMEISDKYNFSKGLGTRGRRAVESNGSQKMYVTLLLSYWEAFVDISMNTAKGRQEHGLTSQKSVPENDRRLW